MAIYRLLFTATVTLAVVPGVMTLLAIAAGSRSAMTFLGEIGTGAWVVGGYTSILAFNYARSLGSARSRAIIKTAGIACVVQVVLVVGAWFVRMAMFALEG